MATESTDWALPGFQSELQKLGLAVPERTVARYMRKIRRRGDPGKKWLVFSQAKLCFRGSPSISGRTIARACVDRLRSSVLNLHSRILLLPALPSVRLVFS